MVTKLERVGIVSTAQTSLLPAWSDAQHIDLISSVVQRALKGCGLRIDDVDFVIDSGSDVLDGRSISNCGFLGAMGAHHKEESRVEDDGLWAAMYGVTKIASGSADVGLIIAYSKPSESDVSKFYTTMADPFCQRPVGLDDDTASGLLARLYCDKYKISEEQFAAVAAAAWKAAANNPNVPLAQIPALSDVLASPLVAAPLRQLMMARPVDGAVAIVLASERVARRVERTPVWVTGMGAAMDGNVFAMRDPSLSACRAAAQMAFRKSGTQARDVAVAEVSATSVVTELLTVEALGLAAAGQGASLYSGNAQLELNRSGGALPANPIMATGLVRLAEATESLWAHGNSGAPSGQSARSALVHASSGIAAQSHCVFVVEV